MTATTPDDRAARFTRELDNLKLADPAAARSRLWIRLGAAAMAGGVLLPVIAYFLSHNTSDARVQRDAIILGLVGITLAVAGAAVFLRYSLTEFLRFWLARQSFDLRELGGGVSPAGPTPLPANGSESAGKGVGHDATVAARG